MEEIETLEGKVDRYNGITVEIPERLRNEQVFEKSLEKSLEKWKGEGIRGVWMKVVADLVPLIPILCKHGFFFHTANREFSILCNWLSKEQNKLPNAGSTNIGVGAFVLNQKNEVLVVREKFFKEWWKLPGGLMDDAEFIPVKILPPLLLSHFSPLI